MRAEWQLIQVPNGERSVRSRPRSGWTALYVNSGQQSALILPRFTVADAYLFLMLRWAKAFGVQIPLELLAYFDLLGVSQGCSVAIAYAVRNPGRVRRMILYGGYPTGWRVRGVQEDVETREAMITLTRTGWGRNNPAFRQLFTSLFFPDASGAEADWFNELQRVSASPENAIRLQNAFGDIDVRDYLSLVAVPTLVLHADRDAVIPFTAGRQLATGIPGAQFVQLESRNHLILEHESAWRRASDAIEEFLS